MTHFNPTSCIAKLAMMVSQLTTKTASRAAGKSSSDEADGETSRAVEGREGMWCAFGLRGGKGGAIVEPAGMEAVCGRRTENDTAGVTGVGGGCDDDSGG